MTNLNKKGRVRGASVVLAGALAVSTIGGVGGCYYLNGELKNSQSNLVETQQSLQAKIKEYKGLEKKFDITVDDLNKEIEGYLSEKQKLTDKIKSLEEEKSSLQTDKKNLQTQLNNKKAEIESLRKEYPSVSSNAKSTRASGQYSDWKKMTVEATGYSLISDELGSDGDPQTATGTYPKAGRTIAVDPKVIPYGTKVYIPAMGGTFVAEDCGGMIKGNKIDIYFAHGDQARKWGRQKIEIYVQP